MVTLGLLWWKLEGEQQIVQKYKQNYVQRINEEWVANKKKGRHNFVLVPVLEKIIL